MCLTYRLWSLSFPGCKSFLSFTAVSRDGKAFVSFNCAVQILITHRQSIKEAALAFIKKDRRKIPGLRP